jgi:zinc transporter 5/7
MDFFRVSYENKDSRKMGLFLIINFSFMFIELAYGVYSNSLGLITDSFHMLFDCLGLFISLGASYVARLPPNKVYTYGYGKVETLSGLVNGLLLIFTAFRVFEESLNRIMRPQVIDTTGALLPVSCIGLLVNLLGLVFFHESEAEDSSSKEGNGKENMEGVFLHVLADSLGSLGVIVSTALVKYRGVTIADPICSLIVAAMILASGVPFIKATVRQMVLQ